MPIITTQRRMTEKGRIRLGEKITGTTRDGREYTRPAKLSAFRFTSPSQRLIEQIAEKYGGTARPWDNAGKAEWEVLSDATSIPVIVVKGGFSQWHEAWTKAGCQHRCDGEKDAAGTYCDPDDPLHIEAIEKPTTRLSVMLSEIEDLGVWRMESKGWNAAAELPSMAELAMHVGDLVPATLSLAERSSIVQTDKGPQTSRFVVPVLDLHVTKQRLVEIVGGPGGAPALEGAGADRPALEAAAPPPAEDPFAPFVEQVTDAAVLDDLAGVWDAAKAAGLVGVGAADTPQARAFVEAWRARAHELKDAESQAKAGEPDTEGVVDAELVPDAPAGAGDDAAGIWQQILAAAGGQQWTEGDLREDFQQQMGGLDPNTASAAELSLYLGLLQKGAAA
ncbi:recombination directionality factor [Nocardioides sp. T2.26MG-1]|uniref:recombination directionality factor n=1 Tax=Nocardioides sp. T2.26MG-1 TaxID=3041166 RepID=UPI0024778C50|nr:hypothetical protein [Nocardioides sp. T2.26MG-1]CAI9417193.1 hypothetical protein HIDPHFAB_02959 [Nocardioides sp. T2.26MG-1]